MARTSVTSQAVVRAGLEPALTAPVADGDIIDSGDTVLWVDNGAATPVEVTVQTPITYDGLALADLTVAVPAGEIRLIGPFPGRIFNQASDAAEGAGRVLVDYDAVPAGLERAVISL